MVPVIIQADVKVTNEPLAICKARLNATNAVSDQKGIQKKKNPHHFMWVESIYIEAQSEQ